MSKLTLDEFNKLPEEEKGERYKDLSNHDKFLVRISMPIGGKVIGHRKLTDKEEKEAEEWSKRIREELNKKE